MSWALPFLFAVQVTHGSTWLNSEQCSSEAGSASATRRGGGSTKSRTHCSESCCSDSASTRTHVSKSNGVPNIMSCKRL